MSLKNCQACEDLRNDAPNFVTNGLTNTEITSLRNNTGLNPSNANDDCEDLNNMNDCLIGNMEAEVEAYDVCDWKTFMKDLIPNAWSVFKGIISAICGLWIRQERYDCLIDHMYDGDTLEITETSAGGSYIRAGGGVSYKFDNESTTDRVSDVQVLYIGGGLLRVQGTFRFFDDDFTDADGTARQGNHNWAETGACVSGGELVCEIRVKKSQFGIKNIYAGFGQETGGYDYSLNATVFSDKDSDGNPVYAYGQHGSCNTRTGVPSESGNSTGHLVEAGYIYIQLRMSSIRQLNHVGTGKVSPRAFMGIRFDKNQVKC